MQRCTIKENGEKNMIRTKSKKYVIIVKILGIFEKDCLDFIVHGKPNINSIIETLLKKYEEMCCKFKFRIKIINNALETVYDGTITLPFGSEEEKMELVVIDNGKALFIS